mgnify:CR=1 FL=1
MIHLSQGCKGGKRDSLVPIYLESGFRDEGDRKTPDCRIGRDFGDEQEFLSRGYTRVSEAFSRCPGIAQRFEMTEEW